MSEELLHRRYLALNALLVEIEAGRLGWDQFWPRFAEFCESLSEFAHRRFAAGAFQDLREVERAADAEQPSLALQHLVTAVAQLRWRYAD